MLFVILFETGSQWRDFKICEMLLDLLQSEIRRAAIFWTRWRRKIWFFWKSNVEWVTQIQTTSHKSMHNLLSGVLCEISPDFPNIMNMNRRWTHDSWNLGLHVHFWIKYDTEVASLMNARYFRAPDDYLICREFTKLPSGANKHVFGFYFHSTSNNFHSSICGWTLNMTPSFEYQH